MIVLLAALFGIVVGALTGCLVVSYALAYREVSDFWAQLLHDFPQHTARKGDQP